MQKQIDLFQTEAENIHNIWSLTKHQMRSKVGLLKQREGGILLLDNYSN